MKKFISVSISILLILCAAASVSAAEPVWQISGSGIGFKSFAGGNEFITDNFYSHGAEASSDYYCENMTISGTDISYKHITPAGTAARPLKQINLDIPIGKPADVLIVNGALMNEGSDFYADFKSGTCIKAVVRTNFPETSILKYNDLKVSVDAKAPLSGGEEWEEIYFVLPDGTNTSVYDFSIFIFGNTNKDDYPDGAYVDIASIAIFDYYSDAASKNIAPKLIAEASAKDIASNAAAVISSPKTSDAIAIAIFVTLMSAGAAAIIRKKGER